jgi:hypothetical protein
MSNCTHQTAPTQFVEAGGICFAYRRFGKKEGTPLVFVPHILGNLDSWDPSVTDGLAQGREVKRPADCVPQCGARISISISGAVCPAHQHVPARLGGNQQSYKAFGRMRSR